MWCLRGVTTFVLGWAELAVRRMAAPGVVEAFDDPVAQLGEVGVILR